MGKIYCTKSKKYKEFKNLKKLYTCDKTSFLFSICDKCGSEHEKYGNIKSSWFYY